MHLLSVGINHRTAPLEVRERLYFTEEEIKRALATLKEGLLREGMILSTCNRTELYGVPYGDTLDGEYLKDFLLGFKEAHSVARRDQLYTLLSRDAVEHLFRVTAGVDSLVIGDVQILGQVKDAYRIAGECQAVGVLLNRVCHTAFHVGKRSITETAISEGAVSISFAAVELARKIFADLSKKTALLIGAGETGELTAKHLVERGIGKLLVTNRTKAKAEALVDEIARRVGVASGVIDFEQFKAQMKEVDVVISSTSSSEYILTPEDIQRAMRQRSNAPILIIDIGVPRDVDPQVGKVYNVFLKDIDDLNTIVDANLAKRRSEIPKVEKIVKEELGAVLAWYNSLQVGPTIQQLREKFENIRAEEIEKNRNRIAKEDRELFDQVTRRILNRILHFPMTNLKEASDSNNDRLTRIAVLRTLFGLEQKIED